MFNAADADRSNGLTFVEFRNGVAMVGVRPLPSDALMRECFDCFDLDHNGNVDWWALARRPPTVDVV